MRPQELGIGRLFESVRDAVIVAQSNTGRIVLWNPAAAEIFGYPPSEPVGMTIEALFPTHLEGQRRQLPEALLQLERRTLDADGVSVREAQSRGFLEVLGFVDPGS